MPNRKIESIALKIISDKKADNVEEFLRQNDIITRIEDDAVALDVRTIFENEFENVAKAVSALELS